MALAEVAVGAEPEDVVLSPDGTRAYVANFGGNSVSVVNTTTRSLVATIPVAPSASAPARPTSC